MEGYAWHSEKKEREARGWRKKVQRAERKSASLPLDRLNSSKFIEPPSDGDEYLGLCTSFQKCNVSARGRATIKGLALSFRGRGDAFCTPIEVYAG